VHDLNHEQIQRTPRHSDREHGVRDDLSELVGKLLVELCAQRRACDRAQQLTVLENLGHRRLERVQHAQCLVLSEFKALGQHTRVEPVGEVPFSVLQQLADEEHGRGRAVALQNPIVPHELPVVEFCFLSRLQAVP
jgi:hypothetical protein